MKPFFVSIPHSGERVPEEVSWLKGLSEAILMCDVDRFVDRLYWPGIEDLGLPSVVAEWHRYVVDLNRLPSDIDQDSVEGSENPSGTYPIGLHWSVTTQGHSLISQPMSMALHESLVEEYWQPFHDEVKGVYARLKQGGAKKVYQLDAHSMPSMGTEKHRDPGQRRPEIVVSDVDGVSCEPWYTDLVMRSYRAAGFEVAHNWPYKGGRVTQTYGRPDEGQHAIQVEMNRDLYMNEATKRIVEDKAIKVQEMVRRALTLIHDEMPEFP